MTGTGSPHQTTSAEQLALIRYAVLLDLEQRDGGIGSSGLGEGGQSDLQFVFPRTSMLAAITHAAEVAASIYDDRVRDRGFYHLFRLPAYWESPIHRALLDDPSLCSTGGGEPLEILRSVTRADPDPARSSQGAQSLGTLDLHQTKNVRKLGSVYADAIAGGKLVIPYFVLS